MSTSMPAAPISLGRRAFAELLGTAALLCVVAGSAVMGDKLAGGNAAIALLANTMATGCALFVLIHALGPLSGAHMNPVVTLYSAITRAQPWREVAPYVVAQCIGGVMGVGVAHAMFDVGMLAPATGERSGWGLVVGEAVATCGLLVTIVCVARFRASALPSAVAAWIMAGYWFTSSMSFANPAATLARAWTPTPAGIRMADVPGFLLGEAAGLVLALFVIAVLLPKEREQ
jgi:glycerol uptake facilitator-like aquaporin